MNPRDNFFSGLAFAAGMLLSISVECIIPNNFSDPIPVHQVSGPGVSFIQTKKLKKGMQGIEFNISPYRHRIKNAYDKFGKQTRLGNMLGKWNWLGILYGTEIPVSGVGTSTAYNETTKAHYVHLTTQPRLYAARDNLGTMTSTARPDPALETSGFYDVDYQLERLGVRGSVCVDVMDGIQLSVRGGICDYRITPSYNDPFDITKNTDFTSSSDPTVGHHADILTYMMKPDYREDIAKELGINMESYRKVVAEDVTALLSARQTMFLKSKTGDEVVKFCPRVTGGIIMPTGQLKDQDIIHSMSTGNSDVMGGVVEAAIDLDFVNTVEFSVCGGYTFFSTSTASRTVRVPNDRAQSGIYPWKCPVKIKRGDTWHLNVAMKARDFIKGAHFFCDYSWIVHRRDEITLNGTATENEFFTIAPAKMAEESEWRNDMFHVGLLFDVTPDLNIGIGAQVSRGGIHSYRTHTMIGTVGFTF
ncbi:hypothetical protein HOD08_00280 [bacterium]|nr:hypothetical protein [bacterium]